MKITKRQLRKIIKEEKAKLVKEYYPIGGDEPSPQWKAFVSAAYEVAANFIEAGMEADGIMNAMQDEIKEMVEEMDEDPEWDEADQDHAAQQFRGSMSESAIYVTRGPYGTTVSDKLDMHAPDANWLSVGEMALALIEAGNLDIFVGQSPEDDEKALNVIMSKHDAGVQGGMQNWDSHVFEDYYDVDIERVLTNYATLMNHTIEDVPYEE